MALLQSCSCQEDCGICLQTCSRLLGRNLAQQNTSLETPVIIVSLIPKVLDNSHCTWSKNLTIRVYEILHGFYRHFGCQWDVPGWWYRIMLASWRKSISRSNVLRNLTCSVISITEWFHSKPQTTGGEKDFLDSFVYQNRVFESTRRSKLLLS